jgi:hypothetical protein
METNKCKNCGTENKTTVKYCYRCGYELPKIELEEETKQNFEKEYKSTNKKKINIQVIVGIVGSIVLLFAAQYYFFNAPSYDKVMMKAASEINESCPIMVDNETRLDNAVALPNNIFQYNYTLVNMDKETTVIKYLKEYLEPTMINIVKTEPKMEIMRKNNTTVNYNYRDKEWKHLFIISVTPDLY